MNQSWEANVIALIKDRERYIFLYDDKSCVKTFFIFKSNYQATTKISDRSFK